MLSLTNDSKIVYYCLTNNLAIFLDNYLSNFSHIS